MVEANDGVPKQDADRGQDYGEDETEPSDRVKRFC